NRCRRLDRPHRGRFLLRSVRTHHLGNRRRPRHSDGEKLKSPTLLGLSNHQRPILFLPPARLFWVNAWIQASLASTPQADPPPPGHRPIDDKLLMQTNFSFPDILWTDPLSHRRESKGS